MKAPLLLAALAALGLAGVARADAPAKKPAQTSHCFFSRDWEGWRAPDRNTIYLRVNLRDIYKVELSAGSDLLLWPDTHLINEIHGPDTICGPLDLDLAIAEDGLVEPIIAKSITKLTPEQVAAIPKKYLP